ncbi:MAG: hypothetical protein ACE5JU_16625 [Candidatus Binatia bacterium]
MADKYERFVASYLRLNGYFTVPNFIVHAGDDPNRVMAGNVGNYTETDIIGVRMPYSQEVTSTLHIANHGLLIDGANGRTDVVIAEVKSGNDNRPNRVWLGPRRKDVGCYIARFVGLHREPEIEAIGDAVANRFRYDDQRSRFRYIVFATEPNPYYQGEGISYITFEQAIQFIVEVRGQCWIDENIGVASCHHQWDDLLIDLFAIANREELSIGERVRDIKSMLAT